MEDSAIEKGIITRIYLENFVTYEKVVIKPGRNLNLIIGPNGTGKSTIVCAIVLGLGGKPRVIGRALHVGEYVKSGCSEAKIEITLKDTDYKSITVTRKFNINNNSTWMLNEKSVAPKEILELIASLNIQVDNLCQFLPQDKVQDFSKMNAQELLENTERSVGDPKLLEYHLTLKELRTKHQELNTQIASRNNLMENLQQRFKGLADVVASIKERKLIKRKITTLKQKKAWILYDLTRKQLLESKKGRDDAAKQMRSLEEKLQPMNNDILKLQGDVKKFNSSENMHNNEVISRTAKIQKLMNEIHSLHKSIADIESTCEHKIQAEQNRDQDIAVAQQQKSKLDNDLNLLTKEFGTEESLLKKMNRVSPLIDNQKNIINKLSNQNIIFKQQEELIRHEIKAQEAEYQTMKNVEAKRLELLKRKSRDAYEGVLWLRENIDKFQAKVHEPMQLMINVKDVRYSKYLESTIAHRDLIAFVCENKQDMNLLLKYLRDQRKLQINAVHSDPQKNISMQPNIPIENIKQYGFEHYLITLIDAPTTIMKYLVSMYRLNNIPVGNNTVEDNVDNIPNTLNFFYSKTNVYSVSMSKYTGEKSTRISQVGGSGSLSIILDSKKIQDIERKLGTLNEKREFALANIKRIDEQVSEADRKMEEYREARHNCQRNIQQIRALQSRINMANSRIKELESERKSAEEIKAACNAEIQTILAEQLQAYERYNKLAEECFKNITISEHLKLNLKLLRRKLQIKENDTQELKEQCALAEQTFKRLDEDLQPLKAEAMRLYKDALETTGGFGPDRKEFRTTQKAFDKLPDTLEEINEDLKTAQAKVFCLGKNVDGENILREYEKVKASIEKAEEEIEKNTSELTLTENKIEKYRDKWLQPLHDLVDRINDNFSSYFVDMKCAGEVSLSHGENHMDFDKYGLKIKVKFRDSDQLQELTRNHQSGGERAVTTAVYMLALQELTRVPFRCVDEINQGMDAINERRIIELIVRITGRANSSQYFLLTPKLLPGLQYADTVTVHCVFNGLFMIPHTAYDTEVYCKHLCRIMEKESMDDD